MLFILLLLVGTSSATGAASTTTIYVEGTDASTGAGLNDTIFGDTIPTANYGRLCYVAIRTYSDHRVAWLEDCLTNPPAVTNIDMNHLEARRLYIFAALRDHDTRQPWTQDDIKLQISSKTMPTKTFSLTTDEDATIHIETNSQGLHLSASAVKDGVVGRSLGQDLTGEDIVSILFDCQSPLLTQDAWNAWGLNSGDMPNTETEAIQQGWRLINEHCDHDLTPGYHYEHDNVPETRLIYDEHEDLVGMERLSAFFYQRRPSDICGTIAGAIDFSCQRERQPFIVANASDLPLFQYQKEAMANGWNVFRNDLEQAFLKHVDAPFLAEYHGGRFKGVIHPGMDLESSYYMSASTDDHYNVFLIKVVDSDGHPIEGASLKLDVDEPIKAGQLLTDHRGHAFVAYDHYVREATLSIEAPEVCGRFYRFKRHHLKKQRRRHTIILDVVKRAKVELHVELDHHDGSDFWIWTNKGEHFKKKYRKHQIEPFHIDLEASEIHLLAYDTSKGWLFYRSLELKQNKAHIKESLRTSHPSSSTLVVQEAQSQASLDEARTEMILGLPHRQAFRFEFRGSRIVLDTPEGLLVSWLVRAPQHSLEKGSSITPMAETLQLLKKVDINVAVCLEGSGDTNAADKEAQLEALLEYEWASQDDAREIIPVDNLGNVLLRNIPAPAPGEGLNVTLISRLGSTYSMNKRHHHRKHAHHSATLYHDMDGPVQLSFCHELERLVVMVTDAASGWPLDGAHVHLSVGDEEHLSQRTDDDGLALLSYGEHGSHHKIRLHVTHDHYDSKEFTKYIHSSKEQSEIVHINLYPQKLVRVHVALASEENAIGAILDWSAENDGGWTGINEEGKADILLSGQSEEIHQLNAFLPWQSTCGHHEERTFVYGLATRRGLRFPLSQRPPYFSDVKLVLPRIHSVDYKVHLDDMFPDTAYLHLIWPHYSDGDRREQIIDVSDDIGRGRVFVQIPIGVREALLHLEEAFSSRVVVTSLDPCLDVDSSSLSEDGDALQRDWHVFRQTSEMTVKMVTQDSQRPLHNVTLYYTLGHPTFSQHLMEADAETAEVTFHLPKGTLVYLRPESLTHSPASDNPQVFRAHRDGEVALVFATSHQSPFSEPYSNEIMEHQDIHLKTDFDGINALTYTSANSNKVHSLHEAHGKLWHLKATPHDKRLHLFARSHHFMGLTLIDLPIFSDNVWLFEGSVRISVKVLTLHGHHLEGAEVQWHVGWGLGSHHLSTDKSGQVDLFAPIGQLVALEARHPDYDCPLRVHEVSDNDDHLTLTCH